MIAAVIIAAGVMIFTAGPISTFVEEHPTIKMLALSFLLMIGFTLIAEGFHQHIPKGYIYFAMAFSVGVELLNLRLRERTTPPVNLRDAYAPQRVPVSAEVKPVNIKKKPKSKGKKR
jgi:predicted tellurium resistance membrane protein TerC